MGVTGDRGLLTRVERVPDPYAPVATERYGAINDEPRRESCTPLNGHPAHALRPALHLLSRILGFCAVIITPLGLLIMSGEKIGVG